MKYFTTRWEKCWTKRNNEWEFKVRFVGREYKWQEFREVLFARKLHTALVVLWTFSRSNDVC